MTYHPHKFYFGSSVALLLSYKGTFGRSRPPARKLCSPTAIAARNISAVYAALCNIM